MFNPIKTIAAEIKHARTLVHEFRETYKYEMQIAASQAKLAETTLVPGYTKIYA